MINHKGFSLIELILTLSIASIISALGFASFYQWRNSVSLINQVDELKSKITEIRQLALGAAGENNWGIHLAADRYIVFNSDSYNQTDPNNQEIMLQGVIIVNPDTSLSNGNGAFSSDLIFTKFSGLTVNTGTITLQAVNDQNIIHSFNIDSLGKIN